MRVSARVITAFVAVALGGCGGGDRSGARCPEGMSLASERGGPPVVRWCKSKGGTAVALELHADAKTRRMSCDYVGGKASGPFTAWHPDGKVWVQGQYEDGHKVGRWSQWNRDGMKVAEGEYRSGDLVQGAPVGMIARCEQGTVP
jgi:hypothetical protein